MEAEGAVAGRYDPSRQSLHGMPSGIFLLVPT